MTTTFETVKVGDRVWDIGRGWGTVQEVLTWAHPVQVRFDKAASANYTYAGCELRGSPQTLFWDELVFPTKPLPKLKVDTLVRVWDKARSHAKLRYFSHFQEGKIYAFCQGATSYTIDASCVNCWENWEVVAV